MADATRRSRIADSPTCAKCGEPAYRLVARSSVQDIWHCGCAAGFTEVVEWGDEGAGPGEGAGDPVPRREEGQPDRGLVECDCPFCLRVRRPRGGIIYGLNA